MVMKVSTRKKDASARMDRAVEIMSLISPTSRQPPAVEYSALIVVAACVIAARCLAL
jgi:hypothetical protein